MVGQIQSHQYCPYTKSLLQEELEFGFTGNGTPHACNSFVESTVDCVSDVNGLVETRMEEFLFCPHDTA